MTPASSARCRYRRSFGLSSKFGTGTLEKRRKSSHTSAMLTGSEVGPVGCGADGGSGAGGGGEGLGFGGALTSCGGGSGGRSTVGRLGSTFLYLRRYGTRFALGFGYRGM